MALKYPEERYAFADKHIDREDALFRITKKYENDVRPEVKAQRNFLFGQYVGYQDTCNGCHESMKEIVEKLKRLEEDWGEPQND